MKSKYRLRIAFDASPLTVNKTGIAYYIERLAYQMAQQFPDVEFIGYYYNFLGRKNTDHLPKNANLRYRPIRFIPSKVVYQLRRWGIELPIEVLIKERCDFVIYGNFLGYPSLFKIPSAPIVHDLTYLDLPEYVAAKNRSDLTRFVPQQIKRSRFVVTVSEFSKQKISQTYNVPLDDIIVTPVPPSPMPTKQLSPSQQSTILKELGVTKPYILFVSTIEPRKNLIGLIDAYQQLPDALRKQYSLIITGRIGWNCEAEIARLAQAKDEGLDVVHLGYVSDEARDSLYAQASLFVSASHYEGFGMPVLEAMRYRLACAVSDIPVFREVAGDAAVYFDHTNPARIAESLAKVLEDQPYREELANKAQKRATTTFSWEKIASEVLARIEKEVTK